MPAALRNLADKIAGDGTPNYELAFNVASTSPILVARLLGAKRSLADAIASDYVLGCNLLFATQPTFYQVPFYRALEKLQACTIQWPRQSGKTYSLGIGANLVALTRRSVEIVVISASMRQAQILRRKMQKPLDNMHKSLKHLLYKEILKTSVSTNINSNIFFESCLSEDQLRGYSATLALLDEIEYWARAEYIYNDIIEPYFNTTNGAAVPTSTPKNKNGLYYKQCTSKDFVHLHADIHDAFKAGILKAKRYEILTQKYAAGEISEATWQTEYMANFYDDIGRLLSFDLLRKCISDDDKFTYYTEKQLKQQYGHGAIAGDYFVGRDIGNIIDHTVIKVFEKANNYYCLRHCKVFDLGTPEREIIDYNNMLAQVFTIRNSLTDGTYNPTFAEQLASADNGEVVKFSKSFKLETATIMAERIGSDKRSGDLVLPPSMTRLHEYINALNSINRDTLDTDKGEHSGNSDQFWATALAIRAAQDHRHGIIRKAGVGR